MDKFPEMAEQSLNKSWHEFRHSSCSLYCETTSFEVWADEPESNMFLLTSYFLISLTAHDKKLERDNLHAWHGFVGER